jgi:hypothetical protein
MNDRLAICIVCGGEYEDLALWKVPGLRDSKCPVCRVTTSPTQRPEWPDPLAPKLTEPVASNAADVVQPRSVVEDLLPSLRLARWVVRFVALLFIVACGLPAMSIWEDLPPRSGLWCLVFGLISCIAWLPNPLLLYGSIALLRGRNRAGLIAGLAACLCSLPLFEYTVVGGGFRRMHSGYFFWQADLFIFSLAALGLTKRYGENPGRPRSQDIESHPKREDEARDRLIETLT